MKKRIKLTALAILLACMIIPQTGCGNKEPVSVAEFHLDTQCEITVYGMSKGDAEELIAGAYDKIDDYEKLVSKTISGSDVDKINKAGGKPVKVNKITADIIRAGLVTGGLSGGDFDISIGRVTDLWDFKSDNPKLPSDSNIQEALPTIDYHKVKVEGNTVTLEDPEAALDLGGIAKGFIADKTTEYLEKNGVESALVNLGGNVETIGTKPDGSEFTIGIERPYTDRTEIVGSVKASDKTVVTSGVYERKFEKNGKLYHHILDPKTGYPADTDLEAVTIIADKGNSGFCDGLSTTCLMKGKDEAWKLISKVQKEYPEMHIEASFMDSNDKLTKTDGMKIDLIEQDK